jgi:glycosyltransferase involved in cell wall biosynthesis
VLKTLLAQRPVELRVLSTREPVLPGVPAVFRRWTPANEIEEIGAFDIGIKPMPDDPWARGKCPMKELQYLALGVPAVCSDVGTAGEVVRSGENGFLARTADEWIAALLRLADDPALRGRLGEAGRRTVVERYSAPASAGAFASALRAAVEGL